MRRRSWSPCRGQKAGYRLTKDSLYGLCLASYHGAATILKRFQFTAAWPFGYLGGGWPSREPESAHRSCLISASARFPTVGTYPTRNFANE